MAGTHGVLKKLKSLAVAAANKAFIISILFTGLAAGIDASTLTWGSIKQDFDPAALKNLTIKYDQNKNGRVELKHSGYHLNNRQRANALILKFDEPAFDLKTSEYRSKQVTGGKLVEAQYKLEHGPDIVGRAISFEQPGHKVLIDTADYLFLNRSDHTEDFSIFFRIKAYRLKQKMQIFRRLGLFEGRRQGIRAWWQKNRLTFAFSDFFWMNNRPLPEIKIETRDNLKAHQFYEVLLRYHEAEGSLTLFINGKEQNKIFVTEGFQRGATAYTARFHRFDRSSLVIGHGFLGALDEMVFYNGLLPADVPVGTYGRMQRVADRFFQYHGVITSQVKKLRYSASSLLRFEVKDKNTPATAIQYFMRFSDKPFSVSTPETELPFKPIKPGTSNPGKGRYLQWKAVLYPDSQGKETPVIEEVKVHYALNPPPKAPRMLEVAETGPGSVTLRWLRNAEMDVINGGRYHIYYGIKPYEPLGMIRYKDVRYTEGGFLVKPVTDKGDRLKTADLRFLNRLQVTVTNQMITDNILYTRQNPRLIYDYPLLQSNVPFYFWVTAADNAWSEAPERLDHESNASNAVVARPL